MKLRTRRFLYSFFIAIFFMAAPPLILYTAGYRYDFEYGRVVETGSLVVKSSPENATIYLNGEEHSQKTPTIINTILPGKINLAIAKEGYHTWEKTITIEPRVSAFEERIHLYPITEPEARISNSITSYWWNTKQDKLLYSTAEGQLRLFNTLNEKDTLVANITKDELTDVSWSPHVDQFLFGRISQQLNEYYVVDVTAQTTVTPLHTFSKEPLHNVRWDPTTDHTVYALSDTALVRIPFILQVVRTVYEGDVTDYLIEEKRTIIIEKDPLLETQVVRWFMNNDQNTLHIFPEFTIDGEATLQSTYSHRIAVHNHITQQLTVLDPSIQNTSAVPRFESIPRVTSALWSTDGSLLVYTDGYGVYKQSFIAPLTVVPTNQTSTLVTRYSQPITALSWTHDTFHIAYMVDHTLRIAELGTAEDPRNTILISDIENAHMLQYVHKDTSLYYIGNEGMLYALPLTLDDSRSFFLGS